MSSQKDYTARRKRRRVPTIQSNVGQPHPFYECIATLRCLLLRDAEPQKWAAIQQMMDHLEVWINFSFDDTCNSIFKLWLIQVYWRQIFLLILILRINHEIYIGKCHKIMWLNIFWTVGICETKALQRRMWIMWLVFWKLMHLKLHSQQQVITYT